MNSAAAASEVNKGKHSNSLVESGNVEIGNVEIGKACRYVRIPPNLAVPRVPSPFRDAMTRTGNFALRGSAMHRPLQPAP
jgi:hypothetical protein